MVIDQLSDKTILVTLMQDDLRRYSLDFAADSGEIRCGLTRLMLRIGEECGLDHAGKSYLIEALPAGDSCLLIISVRAKQHRRRYRIKRVVTVDCCTFSDADALLDWMRIGAELIGSIYAYRGGYRLLPDYPFAPRMRKMLSEYGSLEQLSPVDAARIRELGSPVMEHSARRGTRLHPAG